MNWLDGAFVKEPRTVARINKANPFSYGLVAALPLNGLPHEAVTQALLNYESAPFFKGSPSGEGLFTDGTDDGVWCALPKTLSVPVTLLCVHALDAASDVLANTGQTDVPVSLRDEATNYEAFSLALTNNAGGQLKVLGTMLDDGGSGTGGASGATNLWDFADRDLTIAAVFHSTTVTSVYLNGALDGTNTDSAKDAQCTRLYVGHGSSSSASFGFSRGVTKCVLVWDRALSAAEVKQISVNPWQVFENPRELNRRFKPAAGAAFKAAWARGSNTVIGGGAMVR